MNGYAEITRKWQKGDRIDLELPMEIQVITADQIIEADRGKIALRYGPLIYNVEQVDNPNINQKIGDEPFTLEWRDDLFNGVMVIKGKWEDGSSLLAIPNYVRHNRNVVHEHGEHEEINPQEFNNSNVWINK